MVKGVPIRVLPKIAATNNYSSSRNNSHRNSHSKLQLQEERIQSQALPIQHKRVAKISNLNRLPPPRTNKIHHNSRLRTLQHNKKHRCSSNLPKTCRRNRALCQHLLKRHFNNSSSSSNSSRHLPCPSSTNQKDNLLTSLRRRNSCRQA